MSKKGKCVNKTWFEVVPNVSTYVTLVYYRLTLQTLREVLIAVYCAHLGSKFLNVYKSEKCF